MQLSQDKTPFFKYDRFTRKGAGGCTVRQFALALFLALSLATVSNASDLVFYSSSIFSTVMAPTKNTDVDLNLNHVDALSVQVIYSSANAQAVTFIDGQTSTATITVSNNAVLAANTASDNVKVSSNSQLSGAWLNVSANNLNYILTEGREWTLQAVASNTAISICTALNYKFSSVFISTVQPGTNIVYSTAVTAGSAGNAFAMNTSTPAALVVSAANFTSGRDNAILQIGTLNLVAGTDWTVAALATNTAVNLKNAISATASGVLAVSTAAGSVVSATSTVVGKWTNFTLISSTPTALVVSNPQFVRGNDSDVIYAYQASQNLGFLGGSLVGYPNPPLAQINSIAKATTSWGLGLPVLLSKTAGTYPSPLADKTTYYATNVTSTGFQLSDTSTGAVAGITLTLSTSTLTGAGSFTLTPIALSGTPSFKLQASNDGINFSDVFISTNPLVAPFTSSTTFPSPYVASSQLWSLGNVYYRWLRLVYTAATWGATNLNYIINGKRFAN